MLVVIAAFKSEIFPVLHCYQLQQLTNSDRFKIYGNDKMTVGISGIGYTNANALTKFIVKEVIDEKSKCWLNFGVGGACSWSKGALVWGDKVLKQNSDDHWKICGSPMNCGNSGTIYTVNTPCHDYKPSIVYDMEAAGMVSALNTLGFFKDIYVLKLVSDTPDNPLGNQTLGDIKMQIRAKQKSILDCVKKLPSTNFQD